jgi:hypothetical protein
MPLEGAVAPRTAQYTCRECGHEMDTMLFCERCGSALGSTSGDAASRRPYLLVPPVLVVLVLAVLLGRFVLADDDGTVPAAQTPAAGLAAAPVVTCWDGTSASAAADCTSPTGEAGLRTVFPSFDPDTQECHDELVEHPEYARPAMWECAYPLGDSYVYVTYNELASVPAGRQYFERTYAAGTSVEVDGSGGPDRRTVWRMDTGTNYAIAAMYDDQPYAATVWADDRADAEAGLKQFVKLRDGSTLTVR